VRYSRGGPRRLARRAREEIQVSGRAAACLDRPLSDGEKRRLGLMPHWPFRPAPAGGPACWLCGRAAAFVTESGDGGRLMAWCHRHAKDF